MNRPLPIPFELSALADPLRRGAGAPTLMQQLVGQIRRVIEDGRLPAEARLPSSRGLAQQLAVSRTVITEVYAILVSEGYLESRQGSGTYVVQRRTETPDAPREPSPRGDDAHRPPWLRCDVMPPDIDPASFGDGLVSFRICEPEATSFPDAAWRTCARAALAEPLPDGYAPPAGDQALRRLIAAWVTRQRGLACTWREVLVTSGTTQSLALIAALTCGDGVVVACEDPGYRLARQIFTDHGAEVRPLPVDDGGLQLKQLAAGEPPSMVYCTPSHQFPFGSVLSYRRRQELLRWAAEHQALIIEDDYDSELRYDGPALPALAAGDRGASVAYLGTFSKVLAPSLRLGYVIAPEPLRQAMLHRKVRHDHHTCWMSQRTLARYLGSGGFDRHLRRMRRLYRQRRDCMLRAFEPLPSGVAWVGLAAGLHATLQLPPSLDARTVAAECRRLGVWVHTLGDYALAPQSLDPGLRQGLVLGYGACGGEQLEAMVSVVRRVLLAV